MSFLFVLWISRSGVMNKGRFHLSMIVKTNKIKLKLTANPLWLLFLIFLLDCYILILSGTGPAVPPAVPPAQYTWLVLVSVAFLSPTPVLTHWSVSCIGPCLWAWMVMTVRMVSPRSAISSPALSGPAEQWSSLHESRQRTAVWDRARLRVLPMLCYHLLCVESWCYFL